MTGGGPLLRLEGATLGYGRGLVLKDVDLTVRRGAFLGIIGPNGAGKTTLLRALVGLLRPKAGRVTRPSGPVRFGYVKQRQSVDDLFPLTVMEFTLMGRTGRLGPVRWPRERDREVSREALRTVGMDGSSGRLYRELSGGQKQRCLIARALASEPDVLLLDEPTNDMDIPAEDRLLNLIQAVREERGLTVVLVSHLLPVVVNFADELALLGRDRLVAGPTEELATGRRLSEFFGHPMAVERVAGRLTVTPLGERHG